MVGMLSDVGNIRKLNEDYCGYYEDDLYKLYIIADGMGGHNAGEVASKMAVNKIIDFFKLNFNNNVIAEDFLKKSIDYANLEIYNLSKEKDNLSGMGTTITACLMLNNIIYVANIGDSSCYVIKNSEIKKVTKDHSLVQQLVDEGSITENQALHHPNKNIITRAVGTSKNIETDVFKLNKEEADFIILGTDGLTNEVEKEEILEIVLNNSKENLDDICNKLVLLAKERGGRDNISVIVFGGDNHDRNNA